MNTEDIKEQFVALRMIVEEASISGDFKRNNKAMKELQKLYKTFEKDYASADKILGELLVHKNYCVQSGAAAFCLAMGIRSEQAQSVLKEVAKKSKNKIISFNAQSTLETWQRQGFLRMY